MAAVVVVTELVVVEVQELSAQQLLAAVEAVAS
jgi:hypothetical protein